MKEWWPEEAFQEAVAANISVSGVLRQLGVTVSGWNYLRVKALARRQTSIRAGEWHQCVAQRVEPLPFEHGAEGGSRTRTGFPHAFLRRARLPFRHPDKGTEFYPTRSAALHGQRRQRVQSMPP